MTTPSAICSSEQAIHLLESLAFEVGRARRSRDPEPVHDLRVATRRFTQAVDLLKPALPGKELKKMHRTLRRMMRMAGAVRDCDIVTRYLAGSKLPEAKLLTSGIAQKRRESEDDLLAVLKKWVADRASAKWRVLLSVGEHPELFEESRDPMRLLAKMAASLDLHRLRIAVKEFRYRLELLAPACGPAANEWLERMTRLQSVLGR
jgi:CHAD domain-containing protein